MLSLVSSALQAEVLAKLAPRFAEHFEEQPGSLINRFFGLYRMTLYKSTMHFVVISSVWAAAADRRQFMRVHHACSDAIHSVHFVTSSRRSRPPLTAMPPLSPTCAI